MYTRRTNIDSTSTHTFSRFSLSFSPSSSSSCFLGAFFSLCHCQKSELSSERDVRKSLVLPTVEKGLVVKKSLIARLMCSNVCGGECYALRQTLRANVSDLPFLTDQRVRKKNEITRRETKREDLMKKQ